MQTRKYHFKQDITLRLMSFKINRLFIAAVKHKNIFVFFFSSPYFNGINPLTPKDLYMSRTAPLTSKRYILYIYSTNVGTEYFKHAL